MSPTPTSSPQSQGGATNQPSFIEEPGSYVFITTLSSGQAVQRVPVNIDRDSDFLLVGINGTSTGPYTLNFRLPSGRLYASQQVINGQFVSAAPNQPTPIGPPPIYRAGSTGPELDLTDTSLSSNTITLVFSGIKRLRSN